MQIQWLVNTTTCSICNVAQSIHVYDISLALVCTPQPRVSQESNGNGYRISMKTAQWYLGGTPADASSNDASTSGMVQPNTHYLSILGEKDQIQGTNTNTTHTTHTPPTPTSQRHNTPKAR